MSNELQKLAADAIRELRNENDKLRKHIEAEKLAFDMVKQGSILIEDIEAKINEFSSKSFEELSLIKTAFDMSKSNDFSIFKISTKTNDNGVLDPLTRLLIEDY